MQEPRFWTPRTPKYMIGSKTSNSNLRQLHTFGPFLHWNSRFCLPETSKTWYCREIENEICDPHTVSRQFKTQQSKRQLLKPLFFQWNRCTKNCTIELTLEVWIFFKKYKKYVADFLTVTHFRYIRMAKPWVLAIEVNETMILSQNRNSILRQLHTFDTL